MSIRCQFSSDQIKVVTEAVSMAEELVSNYYKMSSSQWLHGKYDVKTLAELKPFEIVDGPFAQVIRYTGQKDHAGLGSAAFDFYHICLQDHSIRRVIEENADLSLFSFTLYIVTHELIHIVRFSKFLQNFHASENEKLNEEHRVHRLTHEMLEAVHIAGMQATLSFYRHWQTPLEGMHSGVPPGE